MNSKIPHEEEDTESWLMTFADMISLLFAFFVIMFALSNVDKKKFEEVAQSLRMTFSRQLVTHEPRGHIIEKEALQPELSALNQANIQGLVNQELSNIVQKLNQFIYEQKLQEKVSAFIDERGVVIKIADDILFEVGQAELTRRSGVLVDYLQNLISQFPYPVRVEGHTDNTPIHTEMYPSNWELSTARACNVVRSFITKGLNPRLFSAEGFAEFRPIANNDTVSGRAKNRRVELIYKKDRIIEILQKHEIKKP